MARHKKSELDAILEQLKQSYATDADLDLEDSLLETEKSEEDAELASALEKIFANTNIDTGIDSQIVGEEANVAVDEDTADVVEADHLQTNEDVITSEEISEKTIEEGVVNQELSEEEEMVEDVLSMMLNPRRSADETDTVEEIEAASECESESSVLALVSIIENDTDSSDIIDEATENIEDEIDTVEISESPALLSVEETCFEDFDLEDEIVVLEKSIDENSEIPDQTEQLEEIEDESQPIFEIDESLYVDDTDADESFAELFESEPPKKIVLSPEEYTYDELQLSLDALDFFKPKSDITFNNNNINSAVDIIEKEDVVSVSEQKEKKSDAFVEDVSENDISLMLKLGYHSEISSEVGAEKTNKVILNTNEKFVPEKHRIVHGFVGKEFSNRTQIHGIKKKYKRDFISLFVLTVVISLFAIVSVIMDIGVIFSSDPGHFTAIIMIELIMALAIGFITWQRLYSGIIGLIKFDTNTYSIVATLLMEFVIYSIVMSFAYALFPTILAEAVRVSFGGYIFMFVALTVLGELFDCSRESMTFDMMVEKDFHYVTEKHPKHFEVKKSNYVSGYFAKMNAGKSFDISIIFMIGGLPILSIIVGTVTAIVRNDFSAGAANTALILFLSIPVTATVTASLTEFINALKLKKINTAFLGADAVARHSALTELVFNDVEAIETVSFTEINPSKNNANIKKWLNISYSVLEALGGPLHNAILKQKGENDANISHDVTINSICDNGIDLHFDSSLNVLIGDKQFMNANNIKVKTDIGLTTASKGTEKSVIYFAFDGIPQIAFIVSSKVKQTFNDCVILLQSNSIRIAIKSYEPEINEMFFDANLSDGAVRVIKTATYERYVNANIAETGIIATSPVELCHAILYSRTMVDDRRKSALNHKLRAAIGFILVCLGCIFMGMSFDGGICAVFQQGISLIFYLEMFLSLIPDIIWTVKMSKRKIKERNNE